MELTKKYRIVKPIYGSYCTKDSISIGLLPNIFFSNNEDFIELQFNWLSLYLTFALLKLKTDK